MRTITEQRTAIAALSAPTLQVARGVIVVPLVGEIDSARAQTIGEKLREDVGRLKATGVILDITGVETLDSPTCIHLVGLARAVTLLGARIVMTGISPAIAMTLTAEGIELTGLETRHSLRDGLRYFREFG